MHDFYVTLDELMHDFYVTLDGYFIYNKWELFREENVLFYPVFVHSNSETVVVDGFRVDQR